MVSELRFEVADESLLDLERDHLVALAQEDACQLAGTGADFNDDAAGGRAHSPGDVSEDAGIAQEVLAERFPGRRFVRAAARGDRREAGHVSRW